ncbi:hypothetical protein ANRL3_02612 [Anaerolineae bacterium]|nr:hypothetical protein ANRL3_02612 [Anaerolineae bacterium]
MNADKNNRSLRGAVFPGTARQGRCATKQSPSNERGSLRRFAARNDKWTIFMCAILLLAFALRIWDASILRMWGDEGYSVYSASRSLYAITFEGIDIDPHPPLYYYLLHFYLPIAGTSELAIRFFSIFFGMATVALAFAIGKRLFDARVGALAAVLMAVAPFAVHYSQEVRMYALVMFIAALAFYLFVRLLQEDDWTRTASRADERGKKEKSALIRVSPRPIKNLWFFYALTLLAMQYTLYQAAFVFLAIGIFLLPLFFTRRAFVIRWFAVAIGVVILFLPWLLFRYHSAFTDIKDVAGATVPMDEFTFLARGFAGLTVGPTMPFATAWQLAALFALVIVAGLGIALATRAAKLADGLLVSLASVPMLALYPVYYVLPLYRGRLFALALLPLMLLTARGIALLAQRARWFSAPVALAILAAIALGLNQYYFNYSRYSATVDDYIPAIQTIEQIAQPGDVILFHAYWQEGYFQSHYHGAPIALNALENQNDLREAVAQPRNVWAIVQAIPHHAAEDWLAQNAFFLGEKKYGQMRVLTYRAGAPRRGEDFAEPIVLSNGIQLLGYRVSDIAVEPGRDSALVQLIWQATQNIADDFTVSVRATNYPFAVGLETIWAQSDSQPANATLPTSKWQAGQIITDRHVLPIPPGTPPGELGIEILMYDSKSGVPVNQFVSGDMGLATIFLGTVELVRPRIPVIVSPALDLFDAQWNEISLVGFSRGADDVMAGDSLPLTLYWQARSRPITDYLSAILIQDASGKYFSDQMLPDYPASPNFRTSEWKPSETWLQKVTARISPDAAPGQARVWIFLIDAQSGWTIAPKTQAATRGVLVELTRINISARNHRFDLPLPQHKSETLFGDYFNLLGYDLETKLHSIQLTLYWKSIKNLDRHMTIFTHLLDATGKLVAQHDSEPDNGNAPTTSWVKGEIVPDHIEIALPTNLVPGEYSIVIGMYDARTNWRPAVNGTQSDRVTLTRILIPTR